MGEVFQPNILGILDIFLKFGYYVLLIPFRFRKHCGKYRLHTNPIQRVASFVLLTILLVSAFIKLRYMKRGLVEFPEQTFRDLAHILAAVGKSVWIYSWIVNKSRCQNLLQYQDYHPTSLKMRVGLIVIMIVVTLRVILEWLDPLSWKGLIALIEKSVEEGLQSLGIVDTWSSDEQDSSGQGGLTVGASIFGSIFLITGTWSYLHFHLTLLLPITTAMMIYLSTNRFVESVKKQNYIDLKTMVERYESYLALMDHINSISGPLVVVFIISIIPTCIWLLFDVFNEMNSYSAESWQTLIFVLVEGFLYVIQMVLSAEAHAKIDQFNRWIMRTKMADFQALACRDVQIQNQNMFNVQRLRDMTSNAGGVTGADFFTISYGFIGAFMSVIGTYAVVMLQFQVAKYQSTISEAKNATNSTNEIYNFTSGIQNLMNVSNSTDLEL